IERQHADCPQPIHTAAEFADALGDAPWRIAKTLLLRGETPPQYALAVAPAPDRLDLAALAPMLGWRRAQLASVQERDALTGYPPTGVTPIGVTGIPVLLAQALFAFQTVLVGGGAVGVEVELVPAALLRLTSAMVAPLVAGTVPLPAHGSNTPV